MFKGLPLMVVAAIGVGLLQYPTAMAWIANFEARNEMQGYEAQFSTLMPTEQEALLAAAEDYNQRLLRHEATILNDEAEDAEYNELLTVPGTDAIGTVMIPSINANLNIYHGTSDEVLNRGAGHLYTTSLPVGGVGTHSVISAHSGIVKAEMFTKLENVKEGEKFVLTVAGRVLTYLVDDITVVEPENVKNIQIDPDQDLVTLLTCTPTGVNSHRLLVTGHRVPNDIPVVTSQTLTFWQYPGMPWWAAVWTGSIGFAGLAGRVLIPGKKKEDEAAADGFDSPPAAALNHPAGPGPTDLGAGGTGTGLAHPSTLVGQLLVPAGGQIVTDSTSHVAATAIGLNPQTGTVPAVTVGEPGVSTLEPHQGSAGDAGMGYSTTASRYASQPRRAAARPPAQELRRAARRQPAEAWHRAELRIRQEMQAVTESASTRSRRELREAVFEEGGTLCPEFG